MKQKTYNKSGMKQIIDSGWKEFDMQTNLITTGNVYSNTQTSSFIRPFNETECNGLSYCKGDLMNFDMKEFQRFGIPENIREILRNPEREDSVILYMFFVIDKGRVKPFCWVVTDRNYKLIDTCLVVGYGQSYMKRFSAKIEILSYITA